MDRLALTGGGRHRSPLRELSRAELDSQVLGDDGGGTWLVLFDRGDAESAAAAEAVAQVVSARSDLLKAARVDAGAFEAYVAEQEAGRRAFDSFDFRRQPAVGVYRGGRLLTTFNPRRVFFAPQLQSREVRTQLEIFVEKMVDFDPTKVREQKNLEVAEEAGAGA